MKQPCPPHFMQSVGSSSIDTASNPDNQPVHSSNTENGSESAGASTPTGRTVDDCSGIRRTIETLKGLNDDLCSAGIPVISRDSNSGPAQFPKPGSAQQGPGRGRSGRQGVDASHLLRFQYHEPSRVSARGVMHERACCMQRAESNGSMFVHAASCCRLLPCVCREGQVGEVGHAGVVRAASPMPARKSMTATSSCRWAATCYRDCCMPMPLCRYHALNNSARCTACSMRYR